MKHRLGLIAIRKLREGNVVSLDGLLLVQGHGEITAGDMFIGGRDIVDLYSCESVDAAHDWVWPADSPYLFYTRECVKVSLADEGATADYTVPAELIASNE